MMDSDDREEDRVVYGDSHTYWQRFLVNHHPIEDGIEEDPFGSQVQFFYGLDEVNLAEYRNRQAKALENAPNLLEMLQEDHQPNVDQTPNVASSQLRMSQPLLASQQSLNHANITSPKGPHIGYSLAPKYNTPSLTQPKIIPTSKTATKGTKSLLMDRPSHWMKDNVKTSKLAPSRRKATEMPVKELMKPRLASARPLKAPSFSLTLDNPSRADLSFKPSWMTDSKPSTSTGKQLSVRSNEVENVEESKPFADEFIAPTDSHHKHPTESLSSLSATHQKGKIRSSSSSKPGSYRWLLLKLIRENDSLNTWVTNHKMENSTTSFDLHDPRNRVNFTIDFEIVQVYGSFSPFHTSLIRMLSFHEKESFALKRKLSDHQHSTNEDHFLEREENILYHESINSLALLLNHQPNLSSNPLMGKYRVYNPILQRLHRESSLPTSLKQVILMMDEPPKFILLANSKIDLLE